MRTWRKLSGGTREAPSQIRLTDDGDLIEVVDEQVTSRSPKREGAGINGRVMLTIAEATWLRARLDDMIGARRMRTPAETV